MSPNISIIWGGPKGNVEQINIDPKGLNRITKAVSEKQNVTVGIQTTKGYGSLTITHNSIGYIGLVTIGNMYIGALTDDSKTLVSDMLANE